MKLPLLTGSQVLKTLQRLGFREISRKGSHVKMRHEDGRIIVFPFHKEVDRFTLKGALKDAEIEIENFVENIR
jgi:predicted RNA binding protein YcfA (HicA-like mRNA interferase family)